MSEPLPLSGVVSVPEPAPGSDSTARPGPRARFNLFFAIFPDAGTAACIAQCGRHWRREHGLTGTPLAAHRLHVTLHHLGAYLSVPDDIVHAARHAASTLKRPRFEVVFDRALSFAGSRAFVLGGAGQGVAELVAFRDELDAALRDVGFRLPRAAFTPHMTLLYDRRLIAAHAVDPVRWTATDFALVNSHIGQGVYEVQGRWALGG